MASETSVDTTRLDSLYKILTNRLAPVLDSFEKSAQNNVALLRESLGSGDREVFERAAHSLKGSAANYSATQLQELCFGLEADSAEAIPADAAPRVDAVDEEMKRVLVDIRAWRATKEMD